MKKKATAETIMHKEVKTITPDMTILDAVKFLASFDIGAVVIVDSRGKPVGLFSERDLVKRVVGMEVNLQSPIEEVMTQKLICVRDSDPLDETIKLMSQSHFRHIPVVDEKENIVGMISIRDLLRHLTA